MQGDESGESANDLTSGDGGDGVGSGSGSSSSSSTALSKVGIGESAPKPPHLLAVPIQRRPLFPGFMAPLVITDEALIEAMVALKKTPSPFVGVFLLKDPNVSLFVCLRCERVRRPKGVVLILPSFVCRLCALAYAEERGGREGLIQ